MTPNWGLPSDDDSYVKYNGSEYNWPLNDIFENALLEMQNKWKKLMAKNA